MGRQETNIQNRIRLALSTKGVVTFRNNTGMGWAGRASKRGSTVIIEEARPLHAGLCEGSSDLIGWTQVTITPEMVGRTLAVFTAIEVKQQGKYPSPEQRTFLASVERAGGISGVARSPEDALNIIESL